MLLSCVFLSSLFGVPFDRRGFDVEMKITQRQEQLLLPKDSLLPCG